MPKIENVINIKGDTKMKALILTIAFFLISCENSVKNDCVEEFVKVTNLSSPETVMVNEEFKVIVHYMFTNGCQSLKRQAELTNDSTLLINLIQCKISPEYKCPTVVKYDTLTKLVTTSHKGKYFIVINDSTFVKEVVVI